MVHLLYAVLLVAVSVQLSSFATSIYLHRSLAHRGLYFNPVVAFPMRVQLWLATGINAKEWVAVHRKHHRHTDVEGDPHSPVLEGLWQILFGQHLLLRTRGPQRRNGQDFCAGYGKWLARPPLFPLWHAGSFCGIAICMWLLGPVWGGIAFLSASRQPISFLAPW